MTQQDTALTPSSPAVEAETFRTPVSRVEKTEAGYRLTLELPGAKPEDVEVHAEAGTLTVTAARSRPEREGWKALRREILPGTWKQSFRLPPELDTEAVSASLEAGLLVLELPRRTGRAIPVHAAGADAR